MHRWWRSANIPIASSPPKAFPHSAATTSISLWPRLALDEERRDSLTQAELFRLHEECRAKKEAIHPNTRKLVLDLDNIRDGWGTVTIPIADYYERCRPLLDETVHLVEDLLAAHSRRVRRALRHRRRQRTPLVSRVLKETFGRRVRRSSHTRYATAIGLAIQADSEAGYVLREKFTRFFGVWREGDAGRRIIFDPLFAKGTPLAAPGEQPLESSRRYMPVHNIGDFRYLECSHLDESGQPTGDVTVWDEIRFPFDPALQKLNGEPVPVAIRPRPPPSSSKRPTPATPAGRWASDHESDVGLPARLPVGTLGRQRSRDHARQTQAEKDARPRHSSARGASGPSEG